MRQIFWFSVLIVVGAEQAELPPCQNQVIYLNESWSSWNLLPPGKFSMDIPCSYTLVYPNDTALCGNFYADGKYMDISGYDGPIGGVDAFGTVVNVRDYRALTCLPPPWYSIFLPNQTNSYIHLPDRKSCDSKSCTKYRLMKVEAFSNNKTIEVMPGMKPFIIVRSNGTGQQITYKFTGNMSAVYVKGTNDYVTYEKTALGAESFFLYDEFGQIIGTPVSWQSSVRQFSQLIVHEMSPGPISEWAEPPGLFIVMPKEGKQALWDLKTRAFEFDHFNENSKELLDLQTVPKRHFPPRLDIANIFFHKDLDGLVHPKFIQPTYHQVPMVNAAHGETSVTIVDGDSFGTSCVQYQLGWFTFSDDVDIIVHNGFPTPNITDDMILLRLDATALAPDYVMILGCTKTLRVLKGSVNFHIYGDEAYTMRNHTIKGFIERVPTAVAKNPKKSNVTELSLYCYHEGLFQIRDCNLTGEVVFENSATKSKMALEMVGVGLDERQTLSPPNATTFESSGVRWITFGLNKGAVHFEVTEADPE